MVTSPQIKASRYKLNLLSLGLGNPVTVSGVTYTESISLFISNLKPSESLGVKTVLSLISFELNTAKISP